MPKKPEPQAAALPAIPSLLTASLRVRYGDPNVSPQARPSSMYAPASGESLTSDRVYILINVQPGVTSSVVKALRLIKEIKVIDPCWGKPDIIVVADILDQDALTQLVLNRIHGIEGVTETDTHLVYRPTESTAQ